MRAGPAAALLLALATACTSCSRSGVDSDEAARAGLTVAQVDAATRVTQSYVEDEDADVRFATAQTLDGPAERSNTGETCSSPPLLRVVIIAGDFPHIVTSGGSPGGDGTDGDVTAVTLTADPVTETVCHISVSTGSTEPDPSAVKLRLDR